jgi:hypothetical protein
MKRTKTKSKDLKDLSSQLVSVRKEVERALKIAQSTASCCECSILDLLTEVDRQITNTKDHLKIGLLKDDAIGV